jgi:hypothetical protein
MDARLSLKLDKGQAQMKWRIPILAAALLLAGCASAPRFRPGEAILKGETPMFPPAPDSLRCELELTAFADGRKSSVSAAFSAKPVSAYKLDLFGLPGMVAGSFLWTRGSQGEPAKWTLVLFDREEYGEGEGEHVEIGNLGLREISVHDVFSFLWGDFFPGDSPTTFGIPEGFAPVAGSAGVFTYPGRDALWRVSLDAKTGAVREAARADSAFRITYDDFRAWPTPSGAGIPSSSRSPRASAGHSPRPRNPPPTPLSGEFVLLSSQPKAEK